jgi:rare lipoprotein A
VREAPAARSFAAPPAELVAASATPQKLPEAVAQGMARPGQLYVQASTFTAREAAQRQAARMPGARVDAFGPGRRPEYRVRLGPYGSVAQADQGLEMARRSGVSDARILVD